MTLAVNHVTTYRYDHEVALSTQYIRLTPRRTRRQSVLEWAVELPGPALETTDAFGNGLHVLTLDRPHQEITLRARGKAQLVPGDGRIEGGPVPPGVFARQTPMTTPDQQLRAFAERFRRAEDPRAGLVDLMKAVLDHMPYVPGSTSVAHTAAESFAAETGVCQDHVHVFIACSRFLGVPARYVSGYLHAGDDTEHVASHAWAEAWVDGAWRCFDITNSTTASDRHIKLAVGLDYLDACPVRGVRVGGGEEFMQAYAEVIAVDQ